MTALIAGLSLGLGAGLAPGPLLTLVMTRSLEGGFGAGLRVSVAPLLTDAPIVAVALLAVSRVSDAVLRGLGMVGGLVVIAMGVWTAAVGGRASDGAETVGTGVDVWRGVAVNALSPHPWIFWIGVGGPLLLSSWREAPAHGIAFLAGFYVLLIGSKLVVAAMVARAGHRLAPVWRMRLIIGGGVFLVIGGGLLFWDAVTGAL